MKYKIQSKRIGRAIQILMESKGMIASELAEETGFHRSYISTVLSGKIQPTLGRTWQIATALNVSLDEIMLLAGEIPEDADAALPT